MKVFQSSSTVRNQGIAWIRPAARLLLASGSIGLVLFISIFLIDGATRPGYNPFHQWISHLSLGERGWLGTANPLLGGLSAISFAAVLQHVFRSGKGVLWGPRFVALFGIGLILAAVFPTDPGLGYPPDVIPGTAPSLTGNIHDLAGLIVFGSLTAACLILARRFRGNALWKGWWPYSILTGIIVLLAFLTCSILVALEYGGIFPEAPSGLFERISIISGCIWIILLGYRLLRQGEINP